ncbi:hypothetical protein K1719_028834 [Acacia pycnantha]|nr:hypothetical protein K1719_028834 [Acacia pycnantha]
MCMEEHTVVFLCSTHGSPGPTLKQTINDGMKTFQIQVIKKHAYGDKDPKWLTPKRFACPEPFSDDEVEHIRNVFCEYLYNELLKSGQ